MPNTQKLVELIKELPEAKPIFAYLTSRERHRGDTDLRRLVNKLNHDGSELSLKTVEQVFNRMSEAGFGTLIGQDRKKRFKWDISIVKVGKIIQGSLDGSFKPTFVERRKDYEPPKVDTPIVITVGTASVQVAAIEDAAALLRLINGIDKDSKDQ